MTSTAEQDLLQEFSRHEAWLRTALHSRLGNSDEVDEVMQEVALAAANQSAKSQTVERIGPWLYRVALRQVMLFRRKAGRRKKLVDRFRHARVERHERTPLQFLLSQEQARLVRQAMSEMPELERQLLMLKYVEGFSYGGIADRLGVSASAVQSRLHRARAALRESIMASESGASDES